MLATPPPPALLCRGWWHFGARAKCSSGKQKSWQTFCWHCSLPISWDGTVRRQGTMLANVPRLHLAISSQPTRRTHSLGPLKQQPRLAIKWAVKVFVLVLRTIATAKIIPGNKTIKSIYQSTATPRTETGLYRLSFWF